MQARKVEFIKSVFSKNDYPQPLNGEIAFAGRSNVGKSSLLNALLGIQIAKVSQVPGKTRAINYFLIDQKYYFVDLPGYGYARVSKEEKEKWNTFLTEYFYERKSLQMVFLLIDHRHEVQTNDISMVQWLKDIRVPFSLILTKSDKLSRSQQLKMIETIKSQLSFYGEYLYFPTSSETRDGIKELNSYISNIFGE